VPQAIPQVQQCVITGGTNTNVTQNCIVNPTPPPIVLLLPKFEDGPPDKDVFPHRILARLSVTEDLILVACGDGVVDVDGSPWPAGMVTGPSVERNGNCIAKLFQNASAGKWMFQVTTREPATKFTLQPIVR